MRQTFLLIMAVALVGCGKKDSGPPAAKERVSGETGPAHIVSANPKPEPTHAEKAADEKAAAIKKAADEAQAKAFVNTLGMKFVPVPGTEVSFCIWETRVKDYAAYAAANAGVDERWKNFDFEGFEQSETHPVVEVNWNDVQAFCEWLTKKEWAAGKIKPRQKYRLPTDAEWSIAVGLGKEKGDSPMAKDEGIRGVYPWGKEWPPPKGAGNYDESLNVDSHRYMSPVGSFAANKFGLHDLGGNVYEWCEDEFNPTDTRRVLRGMSWGYFGSPNYFLSAFRFPETPELRKIYFGFRCVLTGE